MIFRSRVVVTMDGPPIENGAVVISGNKIVDVGRLDEVKARASGKVVDLGEQAVLPGLINAHCHLDYTCLRGKIPPPKSFTDWIRAINAEKQELAAENYLASINKGFAEAARFGTTAIANLTAFPELIRRIQSPIRTWWFAELIDVRQPQCANKMVEFALDSLKSTANWGLAPHAPFTASASLYRRCEEIARRERVPVTTHLAESHEEMLMLREASGPLYEFMREIGRPVDDCGSRTAMETFVGALGERALPDWIVVHLNELSDSDFDLLKRSRPKFHIVHCPRSHAYFKHSWFSFEKLRTLGFNICLGTDSLATADDLSLFEEMRAFQKNVRGISPEEILEMVTLNPARALQQESQLGRIRVGFHADLIAVSCERATKNLFEEIIDFDGPAEWVMVAGQKK
jgi:cytosine/adenosine deaminase-related metal-dependent hydrolase